MSNTFSTNDGSDESLNPSTPCGRSPKARQMRCTVEGVANLLSHDPQALVRRTFRGCLERPADRGCDLVVADLTRRATARLGPAAMTAADVAVGVIIRLVLAATASNLPALGAAGTGADGAPKPSRLATAIVRGPTAPSARRPWALWNATVALWVWVPKLPSASAEPMLNPWAVRKACQSLTSGPCDPRRSGWLPIWSIGGSTTTRWQFAMAPSRGSAPPASRCKSLTRATTRAVLSVSEKSESASSRRPARLIHPMVLP